MKNLDILENDVVYKINNQQLFVEWNLGILLSSLLKLFN